MVAAAAPAPEPDPRTDTSIANARIADVMQLVELALARQAAGEPGALGLLHDNLVGDLSFDGWPAEAVRAVMRTILEHAPFDDRDWLAAEARATIEACEQADADEAAEAQLTPAERQERQAAHDAVIEKNRAETEASLAEHRTLGHPRYRSPRAGAADRTVVEQLSNLVTLGRVVADLGELEALVTDARIRIMTAEPHRPDAVERAIDQMRPVVDVIRRVCSTEAR